VNPTEVLGPRADPECNTARIDEQIELESAESDDPVSPLDTRRDT